MKKLWSVLAVGLGCALYAGNLNIDGQFKKLKADGLPLYWICQKSGGGQFALTDSPEGKGIEIAASSGRDAGFYTVSAFPAAEGKKLSVSAMVKGNCKCSVTLYLYGPDKAWICNLPVAEAEAKDGFQKIAGEIEVPTSYPVQQKGEIVDKPVGTFRIALRVAAGGKAVFTDVKAELK